MQLFVDLGTLSSFDVLRLVDHLQWSNTELGSNTGPTSKITLELGASASTTCLKSGGKKADEASNAGGVSHGCIPYLWQIYNGGFLG